MYLKSVENVITLGKLIGLLFLFYLPLLSILFLKTKRNDLACPVMGTIFLVTQGFIERGDWGKFKSPTQDLWGYSFTPNLISKLKCKMVAWNFSFIAMGRYQGEVC